MSGRTDREKGVHVLEAFRYHSLTPGQPMTVDMLTAYFEQNGLNLDDMEGGLNYTRRLQGWTENGANQSATLT